MNDNFTISIPGFDLTGSMYNATENFYGFQIKFIHYFESRKINSYAKTFEFSRETVDFYKDITTKLSSLGYSFQYHDSETIIFKRVIEDFPAASSFIICRNISQNDYGDYQKTYDYALHVYYAMEENLVELDFIKEFISVKNPKISWTYITPDNRSITKDIFLKECPEVHPEFYPWLPSPYKVYVKDYLASNDSILILLGPPGTGKTSFIRRMIFDHKLNCQAIYDEKMMGTDRILMDFLTRDKHDVLILEDADVLLKDRKKDDNKNMSRLLNASDGLVNVFNKKIIITANLSDETEIDKALIRPGRTFDIVKFRELTKDEALKVAQCSMNEPDEQFFNSGKTKFTLAEIFKKKNQNKQQKVGYFNE